MDISNKGKDSNYTPATNPSWLVDHLARGCESYIMSLPYLACVWLARTLVIILLKNHIVVSGGDLQTIDHQLLSNVDFNDIIAPAKDSLD